MSTTSNNYSSIMQRDTFPNIYERENQFKPNGNNSMENVHYFAVDGRDKVNETSYALNGRLEGMQNVVNSLKKLALLSKRDNGINHTGDIYESMIKSAEYIENGIYAFNENKKGGRMILLDNGTYLSMHESGKDLAESIINGVQTETQMKRFAESPSLKFLKEFPEPEIRDKLIDDLVIDSRIYEKFFPRKKGNHHEVGQWEPMNKEMQNQTNFTRGERHVKDEQRGPTSVVQESVSQIGENMVEIEENAGDILVIDVFRSTPDYEEGVENVLNKTTGKRENSDCVKEENISLDAQPEGALSIVLDESSVIKWSEYERELERKEYVADIFVNEPGEKSTPIPQKYEHVIIKKVLNNRDLPEKHREDNSIYHKKSELSEERIHLAAESNKVEKSKINSKFKKVTNNFFKQKGNRSNMYDKKSLEPIVDVIDVARRNNIKYQLNRNTLNGLESSSLTEGSPTLYPVWGSTTAITLIPRNLENALMNHAILLQLPGEMKETMPADIENNNRKVSAITIIMSSTIFCLLIITSVTMCISFQRQHGTLDIEMQERNCGKSNLRNEDTETMSKLIQVEIMTPIPSTLEEISER